MALERIECEIQRLKTTYKKERLEWDQRKWHLWITEVPSLLKTARPERDIECINAERERDMGR